MYSTFAVIVYYIREYPLSPASPPIVVVISGSVYVREWYRDKNPLGKLPACVLFLSLSVSILYVVPYIYTYIRVHGETKGCWMWRTLGWNWFTTILGKWTVADQYWNLNLYSKTLQVYMRTLYYETVVVLLDAWYYVFTRTHQHEK